MADHRTTSLTVRAVAEHALALARLLGHGEAAGHAKVLAAVTYANAEEIYHEALRHLHVPEQRLQEVTDLTVDGDLSLDEAFARLGLARPDIGPVRDAARTEDRLS